MEKTLARSKQYTWRVEQWTFTEQQKGELSTRQRQFPDVERIIIATLVDQSYSASELRAAVYSEEGILFTHLRSLNWTTKRNHVFHGLKLTAQNSVKRWISK